MKKNYLFSALAASLMLFASCSQEEIISTVGDEPTGGRQITISATLPEEATTRAMPTVDGFTRRCILQLVNESGAAIGTRQIVPVTGETVSFTFEEPSEAFRCVLWADYVTSDINTDYLYTTTNLPAVGISTQSDTNVFFNTDAADAFCGVLDPTTSQSIMLKRPLTRVNIGSDTPSSYSGYGYISLSNLTLPGYNIFTQQVDQTSTTVNLDRTTMINETEGEWAYFFIFAPVDQQDYSTNMNITIYNADSDDADQMSQTLTSIPVDDNKYANINLTPNPVTPPADNMTINVSFDEESVDPTALVVGDYLNADGKKVTDASQAIAIVFAVGQGTGDSPTNYTGHESETIEAYAMAINNVTRAAMIATAGDPDFPSIEANETSGWSNYNGYTLSNALIEQFGEYASPLLGNYETWVNDNPLTGTNLSGWYIPSDKQLLDYAGFIYGANVQDVPSVEINETFASAFAATGVAFDGGRNSATNYMSSTVISTGFANGIQLNLSNAAGSQFVAAQSYNLNGTFFIRPVVTIFEAAE